MKKIAYLIVVATLSGCSYLKWQAPFDNAEYATLTKIVSDSERFSEDCSDSAKTLANFTSLRNDSRYLVNYSRDLPNNDITFGMVQNLQKIVESGYQTYQAPGPHSKAFCELKLNAVRTSAETVKKAAAQRRR